MAEGSSREKHTCEFKVGGPCKHEGCKEWCRHPYYEMTGHGWQCAFCRCLKPPEGAIDFYELPMGPPPTADRKSMKPLTFTLPPQSRLPELRQIMNRAVRDRLNTEPVHIHLVKDISPQMMEAVRRKWPAAFTESEEAP